MRSPHAWPVALALLSAPDAQAGGRHHTVDTLGVVHDGRVPAHAEFQRQLATRWSGSIVAVQPGEPWPTPTRPDAIIALGDRADTEADFRWPDVPRASVLVWAQPKTETAKPRLHIPAHTETECTRQLLSAVEGGPWIVLAGPDDEGADALGASLGATVLRGDARSVALGLRKQALSSNGRRIWLRAAAELAVPEWLLHLAAMARLPSTQVGSDAPGLARYGFAQWVEPDIGHAAEDTALWLEQLARRRTPRVTRGSLQCRTP